jgi:hypothetical protein
MGLLSEFLAEDRAIDAEWRERAHGMEALVAFAAWLDAAQHVAEADRDSGVRYLDHGILVEPRGDASTNPFPPPGPAA